MYFALLTASSALLMASFTFADTLTVFNPCPQAPASLTIPPVTVTTQYQVVSTCAPTTTCAAGLCTTSYPFQTYTYVSTVVPNMYNGVSAIPTTVTNVDQKVTVSHYETTITVHPIQVIHARLVTSSNDDTQSDTRTAVSPMYTTIKRDFLSPFRDIGPLAIPGYSGSGLCDDCVLSDGTKQQDVEVFECTDEPDGSYCKHWYETWIQKAAPAAIATTTFPVSTQLVAPTDGAYTFAWPQVAPATTLTDPTGTFTAGPSTYTVYATRTYTRHETVDFTTTVKAALSYWRPTRTDSPSSEGWGDWAGHIEDPTGEEQGWGDWNQNDNGVHGHGHGHGNGNGPGHGHGHGQGAGDIGASTTSTTSTTSSSVILTTSTTSSSVTSTTSTSSTTSSTSTTSTTSTTTSGANTNPTNLSAYIGVDIAGTKRKRDSSYVGFIGTTAVVTDSIHAAYFQLSNNYLLEYNTSSFVGTDTTSEYGPMAKFGATPPATSHDWVVQPSTELILTSSIGFCKTPDGTIYIKISDTPALCLDIFFKVVATLPGGNQNGNGTNGGGNNNGTSGGGDNNNNNNDTSSNGGGSSNTTNNSPTGTGGSSQSTGTGSPLKFRRDTWEKSRLSQARRNILIF